MKRVAILGSSFAAAADASLGFLGGVRLVLPSPGSGGVGDPALTVAQLEDRPESWVLFRHGVPHRYLPHQVPFLKQAEWLRRIDCEALLVTSSVGVLAEHVPLFAPILVADLLALDQRLPTGAACTRFTEPAADQGHLVVDQGLFDSALGDELRHGAKARGEDLGPGVVFAYVPGPRTKTPAENHALALLGAEVASMSLGPEVVLANELEIPTVAVVVGHKRSGRGVASDVDRESLAGSLAKARTALEGVVLDFLRGEARPAFGNHLYRFGERG